VPVPDGADARARAIFPRTLRIVQNWTSAAEQLLAGKEVR
jgi:hypothetical protein